MRGETTIFKLWLFRFFASSKAIALEIFNERSAQVLAVNLTVQPFKVSSLAS